MILFGINFNEFNNRLLLEKHLGTTKEVNSYRGCHHSFNETQKFCTECGKNIWIYEDIFNEQNKTDLLQSIINSYKEFHSFQVINLVFGIDANVLTFANYYNCSLNSLSKTIIDKLNNVLYIPEYMDLGIEQLNNSDVWFHYMKGV